jgi:hypothetical protein
MQLPGHRAVDFFACECQAAHVDAAPLRK